MAKVLNPLNSTQASGSVEGLTYSRWRGTNTTRRRSIPVNPNTTPQSLQRSALNAVVASWEELQSGGLVPSWNSFAEAQAWNTGPFNESQILPTYQAYVKVNMARIAFGFGIDSAPPSTTPTGLQLDPSGTFTPPPSIQFSGTLDSGAVGVWNGPEGEGGGTGFPLIGSNDDQVNIQTWLGLVSFPGRKPDLRQARLVRLPQPQAISSDTNIIPVLTGEVTGIADSPYVVGQTYDIWIRGMRFTDTQPGPFMYLGRGLVLADTP